MFTVDITQILSPLAVVQRLSEAVRSVRSESLIEYTRPTRIEPIALIDHTISDLPAMKDLSLSLTSLYAAYYLQAAALSAQVGNARVIRTLDKLNPDRDPIDSFGTVLSLESKSHNNPYLFQGATESRKPQISLRTRPAVEAIMELGLVSEAPKVSNNKDNQREIANLAMNLSTGLVINVDFTIDSHTATIPVTVRLITSITDPEVQKQMILYSAKDKTLKARYFGYKTGELSLKDLMFATDLIDAHRDGLLRDNTNKYADIIKRKNRSRLSGLISGNPSVNVASNILVISKDNMEDVEAQIGGKISNFKLRQRVFKDTYLVLLAVIDPRWEQVTIYHRGIPTPTDLSFKDLKNSKGSPNIDMTEILKSYQLGRNPTF